MQIANMLTTLKLHGIPVIQLSLPMLVLTTSCFMCGRSKFSTGQCKNERSSAFVAVSSNFRNNTKPLYLSKFNYSTRTKGAKAKDSAPVEILTEEETVRVLPVVNEVQQAEDLLKYIIPKKKAEDIILRKTQDENNRIETLDQLISIVGPKNSSKFFCSVLNKPIPVSMSAAMFPIPATEEITHISKVLSLIIVGDRISWCLIQRSGNGKQSRFSVEAIHQASYPFKPRMHFLTLLKEMEIVIAQMPESELYLVEEYPTTVPTPYMFNFQLQMAQAKSIILGLLKSRSTDAKIIAVRTMAVARMFNTYIGNEKVSGQYIVEEMLLNNRLPYLDISELVLQNYQTVDVKVKEGLSHAFLLNMAYWKTTQQVKNS